MPHKPKPAKHPNQKYNLVILVEGWLKNEIQQAAQNENTSIQQWCNTILYDAIRQHKQLPPLREGTPPPTPTETIRAYLNNTPLLKPCGKTDCQQVLIKLDKHTYCDTCGCRTQ